MSLPEDTKIFGYSWDAIRRAQQGDMSGMRRPVSPTDLRDKWTATDQEYLDKYKTVEALEAAGFYGTADRARRRLT